MKKLFIFIIFNLSILLIINSNAQNTANLYGINVNVPPNLIPMKTNYQRFMIWDRMSYQVPEIEATNDLNQYFRELNFSKDNEVMFLGNKNFVNLFSKQKDFESYQMWEGHVMSELSICNDIKKDKAFIKCLIDQMGGRLSFTLNVSDTKNPILEEEINAFMNYNKKDLKKFIKESLNLSPLPNLKKKLKKFSIVYDDDENIALLLDLKFKAGPITSTNRSIASYKDDRLIMFQMNCTDKQSCDLGKSLFPKIIEPIIKLSPDKLILVKNGSISNKDLENFIGVVKTGYRIRSMSKLLLLLL